MIDFGGLSKSTYYRRRNPEKAKQQSQFTMMSRKLNSDYREKNINYKILSEKRRAAVSRYVDIIRETPDITWEDIITDLEDQQTIKTTSRRNRYTTVEDFEKYLKAKKNTIHTLTYVSKKDFDILLNKLPQNPP